MYKSTSDENNPITAILLLNIGSPKSPNICHVAAYLSRFLDNRKGIQLPWLFRKLLVYGFIVPFRVIKTSSRYRVLWNYYNGKFPLNYYGKVIQEKLQHALTKNVVVFSAMCYEKDSLKKSIKAICENNFSTLILFPLFPHHAVSSTEVVLEKAMKVLNTYTVVPEICSISAFYNHPAFIDAWVDKINKYHPNNYDMVLFSYHSLPLNQMSKFEKDLQSYERACYETTRLIAEKSGIFSQKITTVFQSQMTPNWLRPFLSDFVIENTGAETDIQNILVVAPGFVADCLETVVEINEYRMSFLRKGGKKFDLVESLNVSPFWIEVLRNICLSKMK